MSETLSPRTSEKTASPSLMSLVHQISYVTDDIDAFAARLRERFGIDEFMIRHNHNSPMSTGAIRHIALCWVDGVQVELIERNREMVTIYDDAARGLQGGVGAFHHINHAMVERGQWDAAEALVERLKLSVPMRGSLGETARYSYPDARADFGHYLEFSYKEGGRGGFELPHHVGFAPGKTSLFGGCFQRGYVVRDVDAAMRRLGDAYGISKWHVMRDMPNMSRHIALAWTGRFMVELIEPNMDVRHIYGDALPAEGQTAQFHHLGFMVPDDDTFDTIVAQLKARDIPIAVDNSTEDLRYLYADARAELGHYLEYILPREGLRRMFDLVPHN